jgi:hypothetical protein
MGYLSDVARRRIAALLLVVGIAVVVLAITDSTPLFDDPPTEEERAEAAVQGFFDSARDENFKAVCASLTKEARTILQIAGARLAGERGLKGCDEILAAQAGRQLSETRVTINEVSVSGNRARVEADLRTPGSKRAQPRTFELVQSERGVWQISDFGQ